MIYNDNFVRDQVHKILANKGYKPLIKNWRVAVNSGSLETVRYMKAKGLSSTFYDVSAAHVNRVTMGVTESIPSGPFIAENLGFLLRKYSDGPA